MCTCLTCLMTLQSPSEADERITKPRLLEPVVPRPGTKGYDLMHWCRMSMSGKTFHNAPTECARLGFEISLRDDLFPATVG